MMMPSSSKQQQPQQQLGVGQGLQLLLLALMFSLAYIFFAESDMQRSMHGATKERLDALNEEIKALKKDGGGGVRSNSIIAAAVNNEDYDDGDKEAAMMEDPPGSTSSSVIDSVVNNGGGARAVIHMGPTKTGSTTIQLQSKALREYLKQDGYEMAFHRKKELGNSTRDTCGQIEGGNQINLAICFFSDKLSPMPDNTKCSRRECHPDLLHYASEIAERNRNIFISAEFLGGINVNGVNRLAKFILPQWEHHTIVIFYRRYYDLIVSQHNQNYKTRTLSDTKHWERSILDFVSDRIKHVPNNYVTKLEERLRTKFHNVVVMNFHDWSHGGPQGSLFCDPSLNMTHTCEALMKEKETPHTNGAVNLDYSDLAYAARQAGLITIESNERMKQVSQEVKRHHIHTLDGNTNPFQRVCPTKKDLDTLLNMSVEYEMKYFPESVDELKDGFEKLSSTKLCKIDADATLEKKEWRDFFIALEKKASSESGTKTKAKKDSTKKKNV